MPATACAAAAYWFSAISALPLPTFAAVAISTLCASVPLASAIAESNDATATANTSAPVRGWSYTTSVPAPLLSGMPLQKSSASCISAYPRAKYISAISALLVGSNSSRSGIAWFAAVRTRLMLRYMPVTCVFSNCTFRWSVSSFWMNVELVVHSSVSRPPYSQVPSPPAVMLMKRPSAPLATARAPGSEFTLPGMIRSGSSTSRSESVTLLQAGPSASNTAATMSCARRIEMRFAYALVSVSG